MVNNATNMNKSVCAWPKPVPGFTTLYALIFIVVSDFEERGGFVDIDGIVDHHVWNFLYIVTSHI